MEMATVQAATITHTMELVKRHFNWWVRLSQMKIHETH